MNQQSLISVNVSLYRILCHAAAFRLELTCVTLKSQQACEELEHSCFSDLPLRYLYFIATLSCISGNCDVLGRKSRALVWLGGEDQPLWRHPAIPHSLHFPCCCEETSWSVS